jgi:hypothetical protein
LKIETLWPELAIYTPYSTPGAKSAAEFSIAV